MRTKSRLPSHSVTTSTGSLGRYCTAAADCAAVLGSSVYRAAPRVLSALVLLSPPRTNSVTLGEKRTLNSRSQATSIYDYRSSLINGPWVMDRSLASREHGNCAIDRNVEHHPDDFGNRINDDHERDRDLIGEPERAQHHRQRS